MELRQLRLFLAVAEELHFGRAAARVHLSQPALTQQIARLEQDLGAALFERTSRRVRITAAGELLVERARALLADAEDAVRQVERRGRGEVGALRVGFVGTAQYSVLPAVLRASRRERPDVELSLVEAKTAQQLRDLRTGRLDVGFVHQPAESVDDLDWVEVYREPVGVAVPADHRLAGRRRVDLATLASDPLVFFPRELEPDTHDAYLRACASAGFVPRVGHYATNLHTILGLVASGLGFAFVAASVMEGSTRAGVSFAALRAGAPQLTTALAWPAGERSPVAERFRALVVGVAGDLRPLAA